MQIKSEVYKDWKPAHWTQGVKMSKYFHLHQGRVTVYATGIYLIYAQVLRTNIQILFFFPKTEREKLFVLLPFRYNIRIFKKSTVLVSTGTMMLSYSA